MKTALASCYWIARPLTPALWVVYIMVVGTHQLTFYKLMVSVGDRLQASPAVKLISEFVVRDHAIAS